MNLKKHIRLKEEYSKTVPCSEEFKEQHDALYQQVQANAAAAAAVKRQNYQWLYITIMFAVLAAVIITVSVIFAPRNPKDIFYNEDDIKNIQSTFEELQSDLKYFNIDLLNTDGDNILFYDSKSNDKLYYKFRTKFDFNSIEFTIKINKNYNYKFEFKNEILNSELEDYSIIFSKVINRNKTQIDYRGYIELSEETVYFEYTQTPALGDEAFFESIQQIVQVKK